MSDSDNPSSPKKEEMDVSENGDTSKSREGPDQDESEIKEPVKKEEVNEESEEEEEEDEEPPLGLLERPVELTSGKREKKKVERLEVSVNLNSAERKKVDIPEGKGTKLGECPRVEFKINHTKAIDLKPLHRVLFNRAGTNMEVKKNIRQFSGFTFAKGDKEYEKRMAQLNRMMMRGLKHMCEVLDIERSGTKSAVVDRLMDFLMKPSSSGLKVPQKKKRKSKGSGDAEKKGTKRKRAPKKKEAESKASKDTVSDISDSDDIEEEEEEEDEKDKKSESEEEEEKEEYEPPKKKAKAEKKTPAKKETPKKETPKGKKQNGKQEKVSKPEKKEPKKKKKAADSDESDSDDEPLAQKKTEPPSNSELKEVIKTILDGANLEEVTMKTVVKQVYEKYPSFDLTDRKDFIKTTVREIIS